MGEGKKFDYPPLLAPGRHIMNLDRIQAMCVSGDLGNQRRQYLFYRLEEFVQKVLVSGIPCEVWLDGSFLTEKPEPDDLDVTVILDPDVPEILTDEQLGLVSRVAEASLIGGVDSFAFTKKRRDDPDYGDVYLDPAYSWGEQYGLENSDEWLKGFVVLKLRETYVGLRICS